MAVRMSEARSLQRSCGTHSLLTDPFPEAFGKGAWRDEIDSTPEDLFQVRAEPDQGEVADRAFKLYENVNVAVRPSVVSRHGSEQGQAGHPERPYAGIMRAQLLKRVRPAHFHIISANKL
jgi:hypothetical protein